MSRWRRTSSRTAAALSTWVALAVVTVALTAPAPAAAIPGLKVVESLPREPDDEPTKYAGANCPDNHRVIGGGAKVTEPAGIRRVRLTRLEPQEYRVIGDAFDVTAEAFDLARSHEWSVTAYAICAYKTNMRDFKIVRTFVSSDSARFQEVASRCPDGTVAWGAGGEISAVGSGRKAPSGQIGLQLVRTDGALGIGRATGRESVGGYAGRWHLDAYAICAARSIWHHPAPPYTVDPGLHAHGSIADGTYASDRCPAGFRTHGMGGGGGITDGGPSWLREISPHYDLKGVAVRMTGPLALSIGGMVAHQTCAAL